MEGIKRSGCGADMRLHSTSNPSARKRQCASDFRRRCLTPSTSAANGSWNCCHRLTFPFCKTATRLYAPARNAPPRLLHSSLRLDLQHWPHHRKRPNTNRTICRARAHCDAPMETPLAKVEVTAAPGAHARTETGCATASFFSAPSRSRGAPRQYPPH